MKKTKIVLLLVLAAVILFPFDPNIIVNRVLGMGGHIIIYIILIAVILLLIRGRTLGEKITNLKAQVRRALK